MKKSIAIWIILLFLLSSLIPITSSYSSYEINKVYTIHIDENGTLSGYVTDLAMNPIEGGRVRVYFHETYEENYTDSSGYYHVTNIPICWCLKNATASKEGYTTEWILLAIGENTTYDFVLTPLGKTLYVGGSGPGNYSKIQDAIDNATDGDTVFVHSGFYNQSRIIIKKSITLVGEDISNTIIDADWNNSYVHTVSIFNTTSVSISGFTIQNGFDGILVSMSRDVMIKNNLIKDNVVGIAVRWNSNNNVICNNEITGNENLGVLVDYVKEDNNNSFLKNNFILTGGNAIVYCVKCYWKGNYWDDWIGLKFPFLDFLPYRIHTVLGFSNFDWHPAQEPYDIPA